MGNGLANAARRPRDNGNTPVETQIRGFHENSPRFLRAKIAIFSSPVIARSEGLTLAKPKKAAPSPPVIARRP
jgi:hypothetical protein